LISGGGDETWTFSATSVSLSATTPVAATLGGSIQSVDTGAKHILVSVTSAGGFFAGLPAGTPLYFTYNVIGNTLYQNSSFTAYPASAVTGPYIKQ
jgi:hypothetical protein